MAYVSATDVQMVGAVDAFGLLQVGSRWFASMGVFVGLRCMALVAVRVVGTVRVIRCITV